MRSMFSAVSGLSAHQLKMDVIGNNIANINTVGFKSSDVTFSTVFSQTLQGAGSGTEGTGGTNPMEVGLGSTVGAISTVFTSGATQVTSNPTDLMIDGDGFFVVTDDSSFQNKYYTRAGNFNLDADGFMVTADGLKVLGTDGQPVQINMSDTKSATQTTGIFLNGNINYNEEEDYAVTTDIYDSLGDVHTLTVNMVSPTISTDPTNLNAIDPLDPKEYEAGVTEAAYSYRQIYFSDEDGNVIAGNGDTENAFPTGSTTGEATLYAKFNEDGEIVDIVTFDGLDAAGEELTSGMVSDETAYTETAYSSTLELNYAGTDTIELPIDRSMFFIDGDTSNDTSFSQYAEDTDVVGTSVDGNPAGTIDSYSISSNGDVVGVYTNGDIAILSTIQIASFDNEAGLLQMGGNLFAESVNSGEPSFGQPSTSSFGSITAGALEMSNVDLAAQFTSMITTQRGYQACAKVITTSDEILQELVNLKR